MWAVCFRGRFVSGGGAPEAAQTNSTNHRHRHRQHRHRHRLQGGPDGDDPRRGRWAASSGSGGTGSGGGQPPGAGPDAGRRPRLAGSPRRRALRARYQAYTQSINGPPIVPPGPCKPSPAILQNHRRRDRQQAAEEARGTAQQTDSHTAPAPPPASSAASQQAHSHSKHKPPTAKRHSRPPKPQAKPTRRDGERPDDHHRPGPEGCRYSGRVLNLCGCGGAKFF